MTSSPSSSLLQVPSPNTSSGEFPFVNVVTDGTWPDSWGKPPKTRKRITKQQLAMLEDLFRACSHPSREERQTLAAKTGMELRSVTIWLQNKRQLVKKNAKLAIDTPTSSSASSPAPPSPSPAATDDESPQPPSAPVKQSTTTNGTTSRPARPSLDRVASLSEYPSPARPVAKRTNSAQTPSLARSASQPDLPLWSHMPSSPPSSPPAAFPSGKARTAKANPALHKLAGRPYPALTRTRSVDSAATCVSSASSSSSGGGLRKRATERAKMIKPSMTLEWACAQAAATLANEEAEQRRQQHEVPSPPASQATTVIEDVEDVDVGDASHEDMQAALALCGLIHACA